MDDRQPPSLPFDDALTVARNVCFAAQGNEKGALEVYAIGDLANALSFNPPAETLGSISLLIVSGYLWSQFRDAIGALPKELDCRPRTPRFHAARDALRYEYSTDSPVKMDPLGQFAVKPELWYPGPDGPETIVDLYLLPPEWNKQGHRHYALEICSSRLLKQFAATAIPFIEGRFTVTVQRVQQVGKYL